MGERPRDANRTEEPHHLHLEGEHVSCVPDTGDGGFSCFSSRRLPQVCGFKVCTSLERTARDYEFLCEKRSFAVVHSMVCILGENAQ